MYKQLAATLFTNGFEVIPIDGKRPVVANWQDIEITDDLISKWSLNGKGAMNIGVRCGSVYAADFDFYDADVSAVVVKSFIEQFGGAPVRIGQAPKQLLVYRGAEGQTKLKRSWRDADGVVHGFELLGKGQQFAAFGKHPDTGKDYIWTGESLEDLETHELKSLNFDKVKAWIAAIEVPKSWVEVGSSAANVSDDDLGDFDGLIDNQYDAVTRVQIESYLSVLDNNSDNDYWAKIGMCLYDWDADEGLEVWEAWSKGGVSYKKGETRKRWRSFEKDGVRVSVGTIIYLAKEAGWKAPSFRQRLDECDSEQAVMVLAGEIKEAKVDALERNTLAALMKNMLKGFTGVPVPIADVRRLITSSALTTATARPEWCNFWVFVLSHNQYINLNTMTGYSAASFNLKCGIQIPSSDNGSKQSASQAVADGGFISILNRLEYIPTEADRIVGDCLNTYRADLVPAAGKRDPVAEQIITDHLIGLIGEADSVVFMQWLAWQVQRCGELVRWAPLLVGDEGIGKSFFGELLKSAMGSMNVGLVSPNTIKSSFNGWAEGVAVNVLQELKLTGHNRFDIANALKPLFTDPDIEINNKGLKPYVVRNVTNYLVFSNFRDSVPIQNYHDRRWWVSFATAHKMGHGYFTKLFEAIRDGGAMRAWLESIDIPDGFDGVAPMNNSKRSVIETEKAMTDGQHEAEQMLVTGGEWWTEKVFSSSEFREAIELEIGPLSNRDANYLFKKMGYSQQGVVKIHGSARRVWTKTFLTNDEIRSELGYNESI